MSDAVEPASPFRLLSFGVGVLATGAWVVLGVGTVVVSGGLGMSPLHLVVLALAVTAWVAAIVLAVSRRGSARGIAVATVPLTIVAFVAVVETFAGAGLRILLG